MERKVLMVDGASVSLMLASKLIGSAGVDVGIDLSSGPDRSVFSIYDFTDPLDLNSPLFWGPQTPSRSWKHKPSRKNRTKIKAARKQNRKRKK